MHSFSVVFVVLFAAVAFGSVGVFVVEYAPNGAWSAALINGTTMGLTCEGNGMGPNFVVQQATVVPMSYSTGFYNFGLVVTNTTMLSSMSLYQTSVSEGSPNNFCYNPRWLCTTNELSGMSTLGLAITANNLTYIGYNYATNAVEFSLVIMRTDGGCYVEHLNSVSGLNASPPLVDFHPLLGLISVGTNDQQGPAVLVFNQLGVLQQVLDLGALGYETVWVAKFNGDSDATFSILADSKQTGQTMAAEVPLDLTWGTSVPVNMPFSLADGTYQAALDDYLGFVLAPTPGSTVYAVGFEQTLTFSVDSPTFFIVPTTQFGSE